MLVYNPQKEEYEIEDPDLICSNSADFEDIILNLTALIQSLEKAELER